MNQRNGNFSSSSIWRLIPGKKGGILETGRSYIAEKRMEMRLGRQLNAETTAKPINWGKFVEQRAFDIIGVEYKLESKKRYSHPHLAQWTGAPDCITEEDIVADIKCPYTMKGFCKLTDIILMPDITDAVNALREDKPEYYWQLVSNSILTGKKTAEIICYCPYLEELEEIRDMARQSLDQAKISFINWALDDELPYLIKGNYYKNVNSLKWDVWEGDKSLLTKCVQEAIKLLLA